MPQHSCYPTRSATLPPQPARITMASSQPGQSRRQETSRSYPSRQNSTAQTSRSSHSSHRRSEPSRSSRDSSSYSSSRRTRSPHRGSATRYDTASFRSFQSEPHKKCTCCGGYKSSRSDRMLPSFIPYEYTRAAPVSMIYAEPEPLEHHWTVSRTASEPITSYIGAQFAPVIEERAPRTIYSEPKGIDWALEEFEGKKKGEMLERWQNEEMIHAPFWAEGEAARSSSREQTLEAYLNSLGLPQ